MTKLFKTDVCECCGQAKNYLLGLDKGSAKLVLAILDKIVQKGVNEVHPAREMDTTGKNKWYLTNLSRPRFHGLIAYVKGKKGYYCLTRKAGQFLRNEKVPRHAVISKVTGHQEGYFMADIETVTLSELLKEQIMWSGEQQKVINTIYQVNDLTLFDTIGE